VNAFFIYEDDESGLKHKPLDASIEEMYDLAKSTYGRSDTGLKLVQFMNFIDQCTAITEEMKVE
jgi:hypothetical protein